MTDNNNNPDLNPAALAQKLDMCYERLSRIIHSDDQGNAETIYQVTLEAEQLVAGLTASHQEGRGLKRAELLKLNQKVIALIEIINQKLSSFRDQLIKVKRGQNAVKGYGPIKIGMGFTEGKFVDSKR